MIRAAAAAAPNYTRTDRSERKKKNDPNGTAPPPPPAAHHWPLLRRHVRVEPRSPEPPTDTLGMLTHPDPDAGLAIIVSSLHDGLGLAAVQVRDNRLEHRCDIRLGQHVVIEQVHAVAAGRVKGGLGRRRRRVRAGRRRRKDLVESGGGLRRLGRRQLLRHNQGGEGGAGRRRSHRRRPRQSGGRNGGAAEGRDRHSGGGDTRDGCKWRKRGCHGEPVGQRLRGRRAGKAQWREARVEAAKEGGRARVGRRGLL
ncbi:hypothetical protein I4F81_003267 [Pyropia yezoensis]|uniref:Uncharacterized protein n=1 Tax=Pyropia yezoensis TaxID=2788 RepID=A0ACC3BSL2_PYRYE|nr:hypothetical protein I4F81_003267 [Neopyropia yezoensis]